MTFKAAVAWHKETIPGNMSITMFEQDFFTSSSNKEPVMIIRQFKALTLHQEITPEIRFVDMISLNDFIMTSVYLNNFFLHL